MSEAQYGILLIEDDPIMGESLCDRFELEGFAVNWSQTGDEALVMLASGARFSLIISDIRLPDMRGEQLFSLIKQRFQPLPPILFITGYASVESAVSLLKQGAVDYLTKPFDLDVLIEQARRLCQHFGVLQNHRQAPELGVSAPMRRIEAMLPKIATRAPAVLITGESGVGKERVARAVHLASHDEQAPFVAVNCAALPESLLEAELFGHAKGAFTGADRSRRGVFAQADGGTLFLDEIGDMPLGMQAKLLRVIQERKVTPLGSEKAIPIALQLVCATHRDLREMVEQQQFREDLYYRINVMHLAVPPLRDRRDDILWLAERWLQAEREQDSNAPVQLSEQARAALLERPWPGNVRELLHCLERGRIFASGAVITAADLFPEQYEPSDAVESSPDGDTPHLNDYLQSQERAFIEQALATHNGKIGETAKALGISRKNLWEKMRRYQLQEAG